MQRGFSIEIENLKITIPVAGKLQSTDFTIWNISINAMLLGYYI